MRTWLILFIVMVILVSVTVGENLYIKNFTHEIDSVVSVAKDKISHKHSIRAEEEKLEKIWCKRKNIIYTFTNHNLYSGIDEHLVKIKHHSDKKDYDGLMIQILLLEKDNSNLKDMIKFNLANVF